jgi:hypothetical protein
MKEEGKKFERKILSLRVIPKGKRGGGERERERKHPLSLSLPLFFFSGPFFLHY